jgi:hypothetical protein
MGHREGDSVGEPIGIPKESISGRYFENPDE